MQRRRARGRASERPGPAAAGRTLARQKVTAAPAFPVAERLAADGFAARDRHNWPTLHLEAFVGRIVHTVVEHALGNGHFPFGVPNGDVGVGTDRDSPLARIESIDLRRVSCSDGDKGIEVDAALTHALGEEQR
jgi:hypothetical protein